MNDPEQQEPPEAWIDTLSDSSREWLFALGRTIVLMVAAGVVAGGLQLGFTNLLPKYQRHQEARTHDECRLEALQADGREDAYLICMRLKNDRWWHAFTRD